MPIEHIEVERPRLAPYTLRKLAAKAGMEPRDYLVHLVSRHPSYDSAANEISVSRETFRLWRVRYRVSGKWAGE